MTVKCDMENIVYQLKLKLKENKLRYDLLLNRPIKISADKSKGFIEISIGDDFLSSTTIDGTT